MHGESASGADLRCSRWWARSRPLPRQRQRPPRSSAGPRNQPPPDTHASALRSRYALWMRDSMDVRLFSSVRGAKGMAGARAGMNAAAGAATSKLRTPCRQAIVASNLSTCKEAAKRPLECPPSVVTTGSPTKSFSSPLPKRWCAGGVSRPAKHACPGCPPSKKNPRRRSAAQKSEEGAEG